MSQEQKEGDKVNWKGFLVRGHGPDRKVVMTRLYNVWSSMKSRCQNQRHQAYRRYGGRGITVCVEWAEFCQFRKWSIENGYRKGLIIDRIDNDGHYSPGNCHWTIATVSMRNRSAVKLTIDIARAIRAASGTHSEIARRFCLIRERVRDIRLGLSWREI